MEVSEGDLDISPEMTRELLISALRILTKTRGSRLAMSSSDGLSKQVIAAEPLPQMSPMPPMPPMPPIAIVSVQAPCDKEHVVEQEITDQDDPDAPASGNGRRFVSVAQNPYTGLLHTVYYPSVYYPTYYG